MSEKRKMLPVLGQEIGAAEPAADAPSESDSGDFDRTVLRVGGNPLPAIRVQGRAADVLTFPADRGERVTIAPLAFGTLLDRTPGIEQFQLVQTAPATLRLRLRPAPSTDPESVWQAVRAGITRLLAEHGLDHVALERAGEPPEQSPGGKYRTIIPLGSGKP